MKSRLPKISLTWKIMIGLVLGIALGYLKPEWVQQSGRSRFSF
jgi:Na+/H+-dicarboxylate symporter